MPSPSSSLLEGARDTVTELFVLLYCCVSFHHQNVISVESLELLLKKKIIYISCAGSYTQYRSSPPCVCANLVCPSGMNKCEKLHASEYLMKRD